jgi:hypothetical protein
MIILLRQYMNAVKPLSKDGFPQGPDSGYRGLVELGLFPGHARDILRICDNYDRGVQEIVASIRSVE